MFFLSSVGGYAAFKGYIFLLSSSSFFDPPSIEMHTSRGSIVSIETASSHTIKGVKPGRDVPPCMVNMCRSMLEAHLRKLEADGKDKVRARVHLEQGKRCLFTREGAHYVFPFAEDPYIPQGCSIYVDIKGDSLEGVVVARDKGTSITLLIEGYFEPQVDACFLIFDEDQRFFSSKLDAFLERISKGQVPGFQKKIAEAAVFNKGSARMSEEQFSGRGAGVVERLLKGVDTYSSMYLVGPAGSGKTSYLAKAIARWAEEGKRVLVCSGTRGGVEGAMLALCEQLEEEEKMDVLEQGHFYCSGEVSDSYLKDKYASYITLRGIVQRKGNEFNNEAEGIEDAITEKEAQKKSIDDLLKKWDSSDGLRKTVEERRVYVDKKIEALDEACHKWVQAQAALGKAESQCERYKASGWFFRLFMPRESKLKRRLEAARKDFAALVQERQALEYEVIDARHECRQKEDDLFNLRGELLGVTREKLKAEQTMLAGEVKSLWSDLHRLLGLNPCWGREECVLGARVVGATTSQVYVRPGLFSGFDIVVIDGASSVALPEIYCVSGLAKKACVVVGDICQFSPISSSLAR